MAWATSVGPQRGTAVSRCELNQGRHGMTTPSDWCLPACLTRPACLLRTSPASCLLPSAFCLLPFAICLCLPGVDWQTQLGPEQARRASWPGQTSDLGLGLRLWLGLGWAGLVPWGAHQMPCDAMRCDATGRDDPSHLKLASVQSPPPGTWHLAPER